MLAMIGGWVAKSALMSSPVGGFLKLIPAWAWKALALIVVLVGVYLWHHHKVHQLIADTQRAQMAADNDHWKAKLAQAHQDALNWRSRYEAAQSAIANEERAHHDEIVRNNAALAAALSVRGPGAAASHCGPVSGPRAGTGASEPSGTATAASVTPAGVPAEDWATVPWRWLVNVVQQHDDVTAEAQAWRNQHARQHELHIRSVVGQQPR